MYIPEGEEHRTEADRKASASRVDIFPVMWVEYLEIKKEYHKVERNYYGWLGMRFGKRKKEELSLDDEERVTRVRHLINDLSNYCMSHHKPILNEKLIGLRQRIEEFTRQFPKKI